MEKLKCVCGGSLHYCGNGRYICDLCDLEWESCELCGGDLHAYLNGSAVHYSLTQKKEATNV